MAKDKEEKKNEEEKETAKNDWFCRGREEKVKCKCKSNGCGGAIYGFGLIGALFYFFQHLGPATFGNIVMAIINSIAWPALFVYKILTLWKF